MEALAVGADRTHFEIMRLLHLSGFQKESRWIAQQTGATVDQVNIALQRLLRLGLIDMQPREAWRDLTGLRALTEKSFRRVALPINEIPDTLGSTRHNCGLLLQPVRLAH